MKMHPKMIGIWMLVLLTASSISIHRSFAKATPFSYAEFYDDAEYAEILEVISSRSGISSLGGILGSDGKDLTKLSYAYKLHNLKGGDFRPLADPDKPIETGLDDEYSWVQITDDKARIEIRKTTGTWEVALFVDIYS